MNAVRKFIFKLNMNSILHTAAVVVHCSDTSGGICDYQYIHVTAMFIKTFSGVFNYSTYPTNVLGQRVP